LADHSAPSAVSHPPAPAPSRVRLSKDLLAGFVLVVIAAFALYASKGLESGTLRSVGPGALPRGLAVVVLLAGLGFVVAALVRGGEPLGRWPLRGAIFITLSLVAFALTIRSIGLAVAGPAIVVVSGAASEETRPVELVVFAAVMTAACIGLFRYALGLPIPVLIIPGVVTI
jgi:putative tricarboxylic transport membrane protein